MTMKQSNPMRHQWQKRNQRHAMGLCSVVEGWDD
jgi:hypothetical protein